MREMMVHRHLYAHRTGLVDEKYIHDLKDVIGEDIRPVMEAHGFPDQEVYWLKPLSKLDEFIRDAEEFFKRLPGQAVRATRPPTST
jgi:hypothetical protein